MKKKKLFLEKIFHIEFKNREKYEKITENNIDIFLWKNSSKILTWIDLLKTPIINKKVAIALIQVISEIKKESILPEILKKFDDSLFKDNDIIDYLLLCFPNKLRQYWSKIKNNLDDKNISILLTFEYFNKHYTTMYSTLKKLYPNKLTSNKKLDTLKYDINALQYEYDRNKDPIIGEAINDEKYIEMQIKIEEAIEKASS